MFKIMSGEEAVGLIRDGDCIGINSFLSLANPEALHAALAARFAATGHPNNLELWCSSGFGGWDERRFADPYVAAGAVRRVVASHYMSMPTVARMVRENQLEAYNLPLGVLSHALRAAAAGQPYYFSKLGLGLFVDPRLEGPAMNSRSTDELVSVVELDGEEYLRYRTPQIDVAFISGTTVDPNGNITFEREYLTVDALSLAQAAKARGGKVIVQVERVSHEFARPRNVIVPGILVDAVVVCEPQGPAREYNPTLSGDIHVPPTHMDYWMDRMTSGSPRRDKGLDQSSDIIGARAAAELRPGDIVNIGIGIPEKVGRYASKRGILKDITLTVEAGAIGGLPAPGVSFGASIGSDMICDMASQFDFYDGGGLDICFMGAVEVDRFGNVNAHRMPGKFAGIGGFANITSATKTVVFCLNFNTRGLIAALQGGRVSIIQEGSVPKFCREVHSVSFSARNALARSQRVLYVTERCVFELAPAGLRLLEVYDGVDCERQVRALLPFSLAD